MQLIDSEVEIKSIFLDPFNPRFTIHEKSASQEQIQKKIEGTKAFKELINSLKVNIKWVNRIVVIDKKDFTDEQNQISGIENADYLVVEGNNRLACLKSGEIRTITQESTIPVIIAQKESNESDDEFKSQLRITQGIANVMVVKEWSVISKARHLCRMYNDMILKETNKEKSPHEIYKLISAELGIGTSDVRQSVIRYDFYDQINKISDSIPEDNWGYLEAFDRTADIREKFGMSKETNKFCFDTEGEESDFIEEILQEIPNLIKKAISEGINTKQFRDIITKELSEIKSSEDLLAFFNSITQKESEYLFKNELIKNNQLTDEEKWKNTFDEIYKKLELFPVVSPWAKNNLNDITKIVELLNKHIKILND